MQAEVVSRSSSCSIFDPALDRIPRGDIVLLRYNALPAMSDLLRVYSSPSSLLLVNQYRAKILISLM